MIQFQCHFYFMILYSKCKFVRGTMFGFRINKPKCGIFFKSEISCLILLSANYNKDTFSLCQSKGNEYYVKMWLPCL